MTTKTYSSFLVPCSASSNLVRLDAPLSRYLAASANLAPNALIHLKPSLSLTQLPRSEPAWTWHTPALPGVLPPPALLYLLSSSAWVLVT